MIPIHLETSGGNRITGKPNWITLSPKPHAPPNQDALQLCNEVKVIVHSKDDIIFAEDIAKKIIILKAEQNKSSMKLSCKDGNPLLYLQPGWNNNTGLNLCLDYIKHHPTWRLSLQTHKYLGVL